MDKIWNRWPHLPKIKKILIEQQSDAISDFKRTTMALLKKHRRRNK